MSSAPSTNSPSPYPPSEEILRRKRARTRNTILSIVAVLIGLTALETYIIRNQITDVPIDNNVAMLVVFNLILVLIFFLLLLITRNLIKLYNERKSRILGSRFQTKLIVAFLILALFPTVLLFLVANKLFSFSIGNWFNLKVQNSMEQSLAVAREYYSHLEQATLSKSRRIERYITRNELYLQERRQELSDYVSEKSAEYEINGVLLFDNKMTEVLSVYHQSIPAKLTGHKFSEMTKRTVAGEGFSEVLSTESDDFLVTILPLTQTIDEKVSTWGYIVTITHVPRSTILNIEKIKRSFEEYKQQRLLKWPVSANYYITFLLVTLLILFSAIWLGFYMAKGITIPIQELAEGTRRIAEGDWNVKIGLKASDEIGLLIDSFNTMTEELESNRKKLQSVNEDLQLSNIELERRRYYIETILKNIGAGVISIDKMGRVTTLNSAAQRILNIEGMDILGSNYKFTFSQSFYDPIRKIMKRIIRDQLDSVEEQIEILVGENQLTLLVNVRVLQDAGQYLGLVIVFEDLTQMIKAQKIAAWKEVAQGIAHEIKNPLTPIQLNTQRLLKKYYEDKEGFARVFDDSIKMITQEVEGMKDLLNEFVSFSRMPTPNPQPASLHRIIEDVAALYQNHHQIKILKTTFDPAIKLVNLDPEQIRRVFINLFENSVDALDEEGTITIHTEYLSETKRVKIEFCDNGTGISPADREKLFLPHFTTKKRGSGLGLAIVNRIIVDHNGSIQVRDNSPKGTIFSIEIPHAPRPATPAKIIQPRQFRRTSPPI